MLHNFLICDMAQNLIAIKKLYMSEVRDSGSMSYHESNVNQLFSVNVPVLSHDLEQSKTRRLFKRQSIDFNLFLVRGLSNENSKDKLQICFQTSKSSIKFPTQKLLYLYKRNADLLQRKCVLKKSENKYIRIWTVKPFSLLLRGVRLEWILSDLRANLLLH